jgi:hypothetical protein
MDSAQLYQVIFGSERFESYVGELSLLSMKVSTPYSGCTRHESRGDGGEDGEGRKKHETATAQT